MIVVERRCIKTPCPSVLVSPVEVRSLGSRFGSEPEVGTSQTSVTFLITPQLSFTQLLPKYQTLNQHVGERVCVCCACATVNAHLLTNATLCQVYGIG